MILKNLHRYKEFIDTFQNKRDYFECHEILEEVWMEETNCETREHVSINLLLVAVGMHHWRNKNFRGAKSVLENSLKNYEKLSPNIETIGINSLELKYLVEKAIGDIELEKEFKDIDLPLY